jgi:hypothetical protein
MPELMGSTYQEKAKVQQLAGIIHSASNDVRGKCYSDQPSDFDWYQFVKDKFGSIFERMESGKFILGGDVPCYMDFYLFE